jgi:hypothetical protein
MTVESSEKEITFYRDLLGLQVGGVTLNCGDTQEVLDNLFNDTVVAKTPRFPGNHSSLVDREPAIGRDLR